MYIFQKLKKNGEDREESGEWTKEKLDGKDCALQESGLFLLLNLNRAPNQELSGNPTGQKRGKGKQSVSAFKPNEEGSVVHNMKGSQDLSHRRRKKNVGGWEQPRALSVSGFQRRAYDSPLLTLVSPIPWSLQLFLEQFLLPQLSSASARKRGPLANHSSHCFSE